MLPRRLPWYHPSRTKNFNTAEISLQEGSEKIFKFLPPEQIRDEEYSL